MPNLSVRGSIASHMAAKPLDLDRRSVQLNVLCSYYTPDQKCSAFNIRCPHVGDHEACPRYDEIPGKTFKPDKWYRPIN